MTEPAPKVACCLLNWNGKQDTIDCLHSLEGSQYPATSILVADNCSSDGSVAAIRACGVPLQLVETGANLGFAGGYNVLLRAVVNAGYDYVWLLNNDTLVRPDTLTALVDKAESDCRIAAVGSVCYYAHAPEKVQAWAGAYVYRAIGFARNTLEPKPDTWFDSIYGASMLVRTSALRDVGLLDEGYFFTWEETDLCLRLVDAGWKLAAAPLSTVLHKHGGSTGPSNPILDRFTTASRLRAIRLYSSVAPLAVPLYAAFRLARKASSLELERVRQVWRGIQDYRGSFRTEHSPATVRRLRARRAGALHEA